MKYSQNSSYIMKRVSALVNSAGDETSNSNSASGVVGEFGAHQNFIDDTASFCVCEEFVSIFDKESEEKKVFYPKCTLYISVSFTKDSMIRCTEELIQIQYLYIEWALLRKCLLIFIIINVLYYHEL